MSETVALILMSKMINIYQTIPLYILVSKLTFLESQPNMTKKLLLAKLNDTIKNCTGNIKPAKTKSSVIGLSA